MRVPALALVALSALAQAPLDRTPIPGASWRARFFHDEDDSRLTLRDLKIVDTTNGIALGSLIQGTGRRGVAVRTSDGGGTWEILKLAEEPLSAFFLTKRLGWMLTVSHVWSTGDGGRTWNRLARHDGLRSLSFVDENRGFAVGLRKQVLETRDGGSHWTKVAAAAEPKTDAERTRYLSVEFRGKVGVIAGSHEPRRAGDGAETSWLDPAAAMRRRQLPSLSILLQTLDGGDTWRSSTQSILGVLSHYKLAPPSSLLTLVQFPNQFEWPSEVYLLDLAAAQMDRVFREKDRAVQDVALLDNGMSYLAAVEPPGTLRGIPVPGKVRIARSSDRRAWREMDVDYRAMAQRVMLASLPGGPVWAATDTGMILALTVGSKTN